MRVAFFAVASLLLFTAIPQEAKAGGDCPRGLEQSGLLCYPPCRAGFGGAGPMCWQRCPPGFNDHGAFCGKPGPYGRGGGYPWKFGDTPFSLTGAWSRCQRDHGSGRCEQHGLIVYPKCKPGFHAFGCCICSPNCPAGMKDIGVSCAKQSYGRGVGKPLQSVTQAFDKAGKWLKQKVEEAGRALKSLGKDILDGLKKLGKGVVKGILYGPFLAYIAGHSAWPWTDGARHLTTAEKNHLKQWFPSHLVDNVRVRFLDNWTGFFNFGAAATTYAKNFIIVKNDRNRTNAQHLNLLKHEMVHTCQYEKYGVPGFSKRYVDQYVDSGFSYENIKFEDEAYRFAGKWRNGRWVYPEMNTPIRNHLGYCGTGSSVGSTSAPLTARPKPVTARPKKCARGYSWLVGKCRKASRPIGIRPIGIRPIGIRPIGIRPIGIRPIGTILKRLCRVGSRIHYRDRCLCPRGTTVKNLNRSYRMCVRSTRPPVVTRPRPRPTAKRCPLGSRLVQVRCIRAPCPARCLPTRPRR